MLVWTEDMECKMVGFMSCCCSVRCWLVTAKMQVARWWRFELGWARQMARVSWLMVCGCCGRVGFGPIAKGVWSCCYVCVQTENDGPQNSAMCCFHAMVFWQINSNANSRGSFLFDLSSLLFIYLGQVVLWFVLLLQLSWQENMALIPLQSMA